MLENGFEIVDDFITEESLGEIIGELESFPLPSGVGGIRNAEKKINSIARYSSSASLIQTAKYYLNASPNLVRAILFNKTRQSNWLVSWHQDITVSVSKRFDDTGWGPWSLKDDTLHVQPPAEVLNQMVTFRINLDASTKENGCLRVLPKSHSLGVMSLESIRAYTKDYVPVECLAKRGSALIMRPHLLHSSSKGTNPSQRRILHLEFSSYQLPLGVKWA